MLDMKLLHSYFFLQVIIFNEIPKLRSPVIGLYSRVIVLGDIRFW